MNNSPWSAEELDALALQWPQFRAQFPERSYHAWRLKRSDLAKSRKPTEKKVVHEPQPEQVSDEDLFQAVLEYQRTLNAATATKIEHSLTIETDEPIAICFPSDWHIGSVGTDLERLRDDCQLICGHRGRSGRQLHPRQDVVRGTHTEHPGRAAMAHLPHAHEATAR